MYIQTINHLEVSFEHFLGFLDILIASENLDHGHIMFMAAVMFPVFTIERQIYNFGNIGGKKKYQWVTGYPTGLAQLAWLAFLVNFQTPLSSSINA